jgi:hypothetical protein
VKNDIIQVQMPSAMNSSVTEGSAA